MSAVFALEANQRERVGTGGARELRREGKIPAVVYGKGFEPISLAIELREVSKVVLKAGYKTKQVDLKVGKDTIRVLARDVQLHPVTDVPEHVDFIRVTPNQTVNVWVPVIFINHEKSPGLKRGGALNIVRHEIELICPPENIPSKITVDLNGVKIGASIHIEDVGLPEGVQTAIKRNFTMATVTGKKGGDDEEKAEGAAAAPAAAGKAPAAKK